ncbi:MAG: hypothetical protein AAF727_11630 [Pseudomonadota bacterium]
MANITLDDKVWFIVKFLEVANLTPAEIAALVAATKNTIDIFDKIVDPIKRVLLPDEEYQWKDAKDQRWRHKVDMEGSDVVVREDERAIQTIEGKELEKELSGGDLRLIQTYEQKMEDYFELWSDVYKQKDMSPDAKVNAQTNRRLRDLVKQIEGELTGILDFLQDKIGVHLDDYYMHVRQLVEEAAGKR